MIVFPIPKTVKTRNYLNFKVLDGITSINTLKQFKAAHAIYLVFNASVGLFDTFPCPNEI